MESNKDKLSDSHTRTHYNVADDVKDAGTQQQQRNVIVANKISAQAFYNNYFGHTEEHLSILTRNLRGSTGNRPIIWLLGDSSFDNKVWIPSPKWGNRGGIISHPAVNGYENVLDPPSSKPDVGYNCNLASAQMGLPYAVINAAIEESMVRERKNGASLFPQEEFVRDALQPQDIIVVSLGGNDIALNPTLRTAMNIATLLVTGTESSLRNGTAWGLGYLTDLFGTQVQSYLEAIVSKTKPRLAIATMIYYPQETGGPRRSNPSWADTSLGLLQYTKRPHLLQRAIRALYAHGTQKIQVKGVQTAHLPFYSLLDPSPSSEDYEQRVEPSQAGGKKMAEGLLALIAKETMGGSRGGGGGGGISSTNDDMLSAEDDTDGNTTRRAKRRGSKN